MNLKEAAVRVGKSERTISDWVRTGKLEAVRMGRELYIDESDLLKLPQVKGVASKDELILKRLEVLEEIVTSSRRKASHIEGQVDVVIKYLDQIANTTDWITMNVKSVTWLSVSRFAQQHGVTVEQAWGVIVALGVKPMMSPGDTSNRWFNVQDHDAVVAALGEQVTRRCPHCRREEIAARHADR